MSLQDPISDMLTTIRNGQMVNKTAVVTPGSTIKKSILAVLRDEGYINSFSDVEHAGKPAIEIELKYYEGKPVIDMIKRVSKPSLRIYKKSNEMPSVLNGMGTAIVSTSQGVMTAKKARSNGQGGEVLCYVS